MFSLFPIFHTTEAIPDQLQNICFRLVCAAFGHVFTYKFQFYEIIRKLKKGSVIPPYKKLPVTFKLVSLTDFQKVFAKISSTVTLRLSKKFLGNGNRKK